MNLGKLLGAGKSFISGRGIKAYRETRHAYLPKFNAGSNPFGAKVEASAPAVAAPPPAKPKTAMAVAAKAPVAASLKPAARPTRATTWTEKLNPFRAPAPVAPRSYKAVQVELSLEAVKPVSNDLAEADIEVVPVRSRTLVAVDLTDDRMDLTAGTRPHPPLEMADVPMLPPPRQTWEFVGERLMTPV